MCATMFRMAKKRKPPEEEAITPTAPVSKDRHKNRKTLSIPADIHAQLQAMADRYDRPLYRQVRSIFIAALKAEGLWPPPPAP